MSIPSTLQQQIERNRQREARERELKAQNEEVSRAHRIQRGTGCTWTEALRASFTAEVTIR